MRRGLLIFPLVAGLAVGCSPSVTEPPAPQTERPTAVIEAPVPHAKKDAERVSTPGSEPQPPAPVRSAPGEILTSGVGFVGGPQAGGGKWVTVKGQVVLSEAVVKAMPAKQPIPVSANPEHCLSKGPLFPEDTIVNPKTRGIQNVVVWLRPANKERDPKLAAEAIFPEYAKDKIKPKEHVIDQPCCQFVPRITVARDGDTIEFKNSSPINHNTKWSSNENGEFNVNIAPGQSAKVPNPLKYERTQIPFECNVHPWMKGQVRVFDHPYFALTDADGKFEFKNAPAGTFHIVYAHENGFHKGVDGRFGWPIEIKDPGTGTMELKPLEYEFPKN